MKHWIYYLALLVCLAVPFSLSGKQKQLSVERCHYIATQLSKSHGWYYCCDTGIFSEEFRFILENNSKKLIAEYYLEGHFPPHCVFWFENMDDAGRIDELYELSFDIEPVCGDEAFVNVTKTWKGDNSYVWHYRMIMKYESGEWRLDELIHNESSYEKQAAIDYLAAAPFSEKWSKGQDIRNIYEYHLYLDGKQCDLIDAHELLWSDNYIPEDFYPYGCNFANTYRSELKEPTINVIILTHKETGKKKVLTCTCTH